MGNRILFVDDERAILKSVERLFYDSEYQVTTASSGHAGLEVLAEDEFDIVVSDNRMPLMDGQQFLRQVKTLYPQTTRIMLSGYVEEKAIFDSIVDGSCNMYLLKPWKGEELRGKLKRIMESRKVFSRKGIIAIANQLDNLSVAPKLHKNLNTLIENGVDIESVAAFIETDPMVAVAILRIVNSAFEHIETGSLIKAVTYLGLNTTKTIALSCKLFDSTDKTTLPFDTEMLAAHAQRSNAILTRIYSDLLEKELPADFQTAGLLSNLGLLLYLHYFPEKYEQVIIDQDNGLKKTLFQHEKAVLGVTHQEIGGYLMHWWGLPYPIVESALFHHEPLQDSIINQELVAAVHVANYLAWQPLNPDLAELETGVFQVLGIAQEDCLDLGKRFIFI
ncbi:MAG: HDOD domain-containing protein [Negativicutes bacterium]|nr:HDOD domain-containing protein [Negativicutes bacterium]